VRIVLVVIVLCAAHTAVAFCGALGAFLDLVPLDVQEPLILFTDWSRIGSSLGLETLTSASPLEQRLQLVLSTTRQHAAASAYGVAHFSGHADAWGWDTADLDWEASIVSRALPPIYVLKLHAGFDFAPVAARFAERGFVQTMSHGAVVFQHQLELGADWIHETELSILNTAYIEAEDLLILSSFPAGIEAALDVRSGASPSLGEEPFVSDAVRHLGEAPLSATLLVGLGECLRFTTNPLLEVLGKIPTEEDVEAMRNAVSCSELLVPYRVLAAGYTTTDGHPTGSLVFEYDTPALAQLDLAPRRLLAEEGTSREFEAPIREVYFTVIDGRVEDSAIVLTVHPTEDQPRRLFWMISHRDAPFAGCST